MSVPVPDLNRTYASEKKTREQDSARLECQVDCTKRGRRLRRATTINVRTAAVERVRTSVKLAGSMRKDPKATRVRSEFAAKQAIAVAVRTAVMVSSVVIFAIITD